MKISSKKVKKKKKNPLLLRQPQSDRNVKQIFQSRDKYRKGQQKKKKNPSYYVNHNNKYQTVNVKQIFQSRDKYRKNRRVWQANVA